MKRLLFLLLLKATFARAGAEISPPEIEYRSIELQVQVSEQQQVKGLLKIPQGLRSSQKVPVFLVFGGFESAGEVLSLLHPKVPVALASFNYPFAAPRKFHFPESLSALPEAKQLFPKTIYGIRDLIQQLKKRPELDRMILIGASFGTPFALATAALEKDVQGLVIVHGFGKAPETLESVILRSWLPRYGWPARPLAWLASRLGWYYLGIKAPEEYASSLHSQQRVLMITAERDSFIPRSSSDSLWTALKNHARSKSELVVMPSDHLLPGSSALISEIMFQIQTWLSKYPH